MSLSPLSRANSRAWRTPSAFSSSSAAGEAFVARARELRIAWTEDKTPALVAALHSGDLDGMVVALEAELGPVEHAVIARDAFLLAMSPRHPLAASDAPMNIERVDQKSLLLLAEGHCLRGQSLLACGTDSAARGAGLAATSLPTLARMVAAGEGLTLLPELSLGLENRRGDLRAAYPRLGAASRTPGRERRAR